MINGLIWNPRGIEDKCKRDFVRETVDRHKIDFIGLQETIKHDFSKAILLSIGREILFNWAWTPAKGRSGGILLGVNTNTIDVLEKEMGDYFIRFLVHSKLENFTWNLVVVYVDAQPTGKAKFLVELVHIIKHS